MRHSVSANQPLLRVGALIESFGTRGIFLLTSGFPLLLCFSALLVVEDRSELPLETGRMIRQKGDIDLGLHINPLFPALGQTELWKDRHGSC